MTAALHLDQIQITNNFNNINLFLKCECEPFFSRNSYLKPDCKTNMFWMKIMDESDSNITLVLI